MAREITDTLAFYPRCRDEISFVGNPVIQKDEDGTYLLDAICKVTSENYDGTVVYHRSIINWVYVTDYLGGEEGSEPGETFELVRFTSSNGGDLTYKRKIAFGKIEYESLA
jgi:hypothetical protein